MPVNWSISQSGKTRRDLALRPLTARVFSEVEAAWLGAFIEADGSAFIRRGIQPIVVVTQNEVEIISTCLRITQVGTVQLDKGSCWFWYAGAYENTLYVAQRCAPYSMKCQRIVTEITREKDAQLRG